MNEVEFIEALKQGEHEAFRMLVNRYKTMVVSTCFYLTQDNDDAQDIAQDVFIEVFLSVGKFRGNASISTWLYRIAVNKSLNFKKKKNSMGIFRSLDTIFGSQKQSQFVGIDDSQTSIEREHEYERRQKALYQAINSLPDSQRAVFTLHKFNKLPYQDIAEIMNTTLPAIESLMHRAKKNLQANLVKTIKKETL